MLKKLKNLLTNNIGLKFLSVLFAMILWLVVVNIDDPDKTSTFTTNITIANENAIADMGKSYSIINDSGTVTFRGITSIDTKEDFVKYMEAASGNGRYGKYRTA